MKITLLTVHDATSPRKVDFHFWADVFSARGHNVDFITVGFSPFTFLKKCGRRYKGPFNRWVTIDFGARKFLWCPPFHPFTVGNRFFDALTAPIFKLYPKLLPQTLLNGMAGTDIFIIENGVGLMLLSAIIRICPAAKIIYSVCDRIETLGYHSIIVKAEEEALSKVDLVRVPAKVMLADYPAHPNVRFIPHGLDKKIFDEAHENPYKRGKNAVSVGDMLFDADAVGVLARNFPDWTFHLFGKQAVLPQAFPNVVMHGEKPFAHIIPYIKHADIGIAPYRPAPNADYISQSSMKMIQYAYCRLPILAPTFAAAGREHVFAYNPSDKDSIVTAMQKAAAFDRKAIGMPALGDWPSVVDEMYEGLGLPVSSPARSGSGLPQ